MDFFRPGESHGFFYLSQPFGVGDDYIVRHIIDF
jgi:hypothetical protein